MSHFGSTVRRVREALRAGDGRFSLRQVARRVGKEAPDEAVFRIVRVVREGDW